MRTGLPGAQSKAAAEFVIAEQPRISQTRRDGAGVFSAVRVDSASAGRTDLMVTLIGTYTQHLILVPYSEFPPVWSVENWSATGIELLVTDDTGSWLTYRFATFVPAGAQGAGSPQLISSASRPSSRQISSQPTAVSGRPAVSTNKAKPEARDSGRSWRTSANPTGPGPTSVPGIPQKFLPIFEAAREHFRMGVPRGGERRREQLRYRQLSRHRRALRQSTYVGAAGPMQIGIGAMWQQANSWRDPDRNVAPPTIFDHAAGRILQEVHDRTGLDPNPGTGSCHRAGARARVPGDARRTRPCSPTG
jgi:hypothetical protein